MRFPNQISGLSEAICIDLSIPCGGKEGREGESGQRPAPSFVYIIMVQVANVIKMGDFIGEVD